MARFSRSVPAVISLLTAVAIVAGACSSTPAASKLTDPNQIMTQAFDNVAKAKSFHLKATASGKITSSDLGIPGVGGADGGSLKIDGAELEGDVDVANEAGHLSFSVPTALLNGDLVFVDKTAYLKVSLLGSKYTKYPLSDLESMVPVPLPSASAAASAVASGDLAKELKDAGVVPELKGTDKIAGADAYHIALTFPIEKLNAAIASDGSSTASGMKLDSASADLWVYVDGVRPAQFELKGASSSVGNLDLTATFSAYDRSVTVKAPAASEIQQ